MTESSPSIELLKAGDERSWEEAFRLFWPCAFHSASHPMAKLTPSEAEDVAIEALQELTRSIHKLKTVEEIKPFLSHMAYCMAITSLRKKLSAKRGAGKVSSLEHLTEREGSDWEPSGDAPLEPLDNQELSSLLKQGLNSLDDQTVMILEDHFVRGLAYKEIAEKHRIPMGTVCTLIARGLKKIKSNLNFSPNLLKELKEYLR